MTLKEENNIPDGYRTSGRSVAKNAVFQIGGRLAVIASMLVTLVFGSLPMILISGCLTGFPLKWKTSVKIIQLATEWILILKVNLSTLM